MAQLFITINLFGKENYICYEYTSYRDTMEPGVKGRGDEGEDGEPGEMGISIGGVPFED